MTSLLYYRTKTKFYDKSKTSCQSKIPVWRQILSVWWLYKNHANLCELKKKTFNLSSKGIDMQSLNEILKFCPENLNTVHSSLKWCNERSSNNFRVKAAHNWGCIVFVKLSIVLMAARTSNTSQITALLLTQNCVAYSKLWKSSQSSVKYHLRGISTFSQ